MATSNTTTFNPPITTLIKQAWIKLDYIMEDEEPSAAMYEEGLFKRQRPGQGLGGLGPARLDRGGYDPVPPARAARYVTGGTTTPTTPVTPKPGNASPWPWARSRPPPRSPWRTRASSSGMNIGVVLNAA
jgi:hypothetical protein